jgi:hypothetical protein
MEDSTSRSPLIEEEGVKAKRTTEGLELEDLYEAGRTEVHAMAPGRVVTEEEEGLQGRRKRPRHGWIDHRAWSRSLDAESTSRVFTIKAYYGTPQPASERTILQAKKLVNMIKFMKKVGFSEADCKGIKHVLAWRIRQVTPCVTFKIDSREGLQRALMVPLTTWKFDLMHSFRVTMPLRGDAPLGRMKIEENEHFRFFNPHHIQDPNDRERYIKDKVRDGLDEEFVVDVIDGKIPLDDWWPTRTVEGHGFDIHSMFEDNPKLEKYRNNPAAMAASNDDMVWPGILLKSGGAMSLDEVALEEGDTLDFSYDFGDTNGLHMVIVDIEDDVALLPEISEPFLTDGDTNARYIDDAVSTRAHVLSAVGYKVPGSCY